jgi:hypothetical protein
VQLVFLLIQVHVRCIIGVSLEYFNQPIVVMLDYIFQQAQMDVYGQKMLNVRK